MNRKVEFIFLGIYLDETYQIEYHSNFCMAGMKPKIKLDLSGTKLNRQHCCASARAGEGAKWNVWNVRFDYDLERKIRPIQRHPSTSPLSLFLSPLACQGQWHKFAYPTNICESSRDECTPRGVARGEQGEGAAIVAFVVADDFRCQHKCH